MTRTQAPLVYGEKLERWIRIRADAFFNGGEGVAGVSTPSVLLAILDHAKAAAIQAVEPKPFTITLEQAAEIVGHFRTQFRGLYYEDASGPFGTLKYYMEGGPLFGVPIEVALPEWSA